MIRRPSGRGRSNPIEARSREVEFFNESIDRPNRIVLVNPVFQLFRKQRRLLAINPFNEAPHPIPRSLPESPRESYMKQAVFTHPGSGTDIPRQGHRIASFTTE
jgi:hypothetical protein